MAIGTGASEPLAAPGACANDPHSDGRAAVAGKALGKHHALVALLLYAVTAMVFQRHVVAHLGSVCACNGSDATQFMWSMVWWPHALLHGLNPFVTHEIWANHSIDTAAQTTIPGPALLAAPLTALAGPLLSYNVINLIAPLTGAWFAYRLCLYLTRRPAASILGGYLYGFSVYGLGELQGHTHLVFTFAAPAAVLLTLKRLDGVITARRYLALTAVVLIAQLLCGTEMLMTLTCLGAVALACALIFSAPKQRLNILALLPYLAGAYAVFAVVCSVFIYYAVTGPAIAVGRGILFPADALSFVIPPPIMLIGGHRFLSVAGVFAGNTSENGTYLGLPLILIVAAYAVQQWRTRAANVLLSVGAVAVLWSLGETLTIVGHPTIPLPWKLFSGLPLLNEVIPTRIGVYIWLVCAVIAALWLSEPGTSMLRRWSLALLAAVLLIPNVNAKTPGGDVNVFNQRYSDPSFFTTDLYRRYLRPGEVVFPIPNANAGPSLLWQAQTGMYFRLASGDFYTPLDYWHDLFYQETINNLPFTDPVADARSFLALHHVSAIVVDGAQAGPWPRVFAQLGLSDVSTGGVLLYRLPSA
jgi:hypothetical protein